MSIKVYPTQQKNTDKVDGLDTQLTDCRSEFVTGQKTRSNRVAMDSIQTAVVSVTQDNAVEAGSTTRKIVKTAHGVSAGDLIRFTDNANIYRELNVKYVIDANTFILDGKLPTAPTAGDLFDHLVYITQRADVTGAVIVVTSLVNNSEGYFTQNFSTSNLADSAAVDVQQGIASVKRVSVTNNSGTSFTLDAGTTGSEIIIAPGYSGEIVFICNSTEVVNLTNVSGAAATSGEIFINFITEV